MTVDEMHRKLRDDYQCVMIFINERNDILSCKFYCKRNNKIYRYSTRDGFDDVFSEILARVERDQT